MSYILGALKKAEKERRRDRSLDLNDWDHETWENPAVAQSGPSKLLWVVFLTLLLLLGLVGWLAFQVMGKDSEPSFVKATQSIPQQQQASTEVIEQQQIDASSPEVVPVHIEDQAFSQAITAPTEELPLPQLPEFSGHIYFAGNAALSRVFSNSKSYRQGDKVQGYEVEAILEREVVLRRSGQQYQVSLTD